MKTRERTVYKFEVYVTDFNGITLDDIENELKNAVDCGAVVKLVGSRKVDWHDEIDLNMTDTTQEAHEKLFK